MKFQDRSDYYLTIAENDIIGRMQHLLRQEGYFLSEENGRITADLNPSWETPWHHVGDSSQIDCYTWHTIIFNTLGFIPFGCLKCFKVVVRPKTLKQLFALLDLQLEMGHPSKCGIEVRETVRGLYGGYFYNRSLDEAIECFKKVKARMAEDPILRDLLDAKDENGISKKVILKRGCTEFEMKFGRSDQWRTTEENMKLESLVDQYITKKGPMKQTDIMILNLHGRWIRFAWEHDDPTVDEFTGGIPLHPPVVTYHHVIEIEKEQQ